MRLIEVHFVFEGSEIASRVRYEDVLWTWQRKMPTGLVLFIYLLFSHLLQTIHSCIPIFLSSYSVLYILPDLLKLCTELWHSQARSARTNQRAICANAFRGQPLHGRRRREATDTMSDRGR